ncbi:MAG: LysE family transporter [Rhodobacteraceae bacterium]|nr:LysE family transporter [Paracoccaceae bacterium]
MFLSLTGLALATLWTPGPNNAMLASSGATHGLRATAPHALGVALGFGLMLGCVGLGLGAAFEARPALGIAMKYASAAVLIWIAWKIGTAGGLRSAEGRARPFRFHEAAAFQWINPRPGRWRSRWRGRRQPRPRGPARR